jgi:hypothetical protein
LPRRPPDRDAILRIVDHKVLGQQSGKGDMVILYQRRIYYIDGLQHRSNLRFFRSGGNSELAAFHSANADAVNISTIGVTRIAFPSRRTYVITVLLKCQLNHGVNQPFLCHFSRERHYTKKRSMANDFPKNGEFRSLPCLTVHPGGKR